MLVHLGMRECHFYWKPVKKKVRTACCPNSSHVPKHIQRTGTMPWGFSAVDWKVETKQCILFYFILLRNSVADGFAEATGPRTSVSLSSSQAGKDDGMDNDAWIVCDRFDHDDSDDALAKVQVGRVL